MGTLGPSIANLAGGNMRGSCEPPGTGTPVPPHTAFLTQAGQGDEAYCAKYPVSGPLPIP